MEKFDHLFIQPRDYTKSFRFYTEVLGWKTSYSHGEESDAGRLSYLHFGEFKLVLAEDHDLTHPDSKPESYKTKGRISIHFDTKDVDLSFSKIKEGPHVVVRPENTHWGTRWFVVEDPDGNQFGWQGPPKV
jgi:catechol 2,3-dioxygenase-like lactoylglutathione lyase family enzyme